MQDSNPFSDLMPQQTSAPMQAAPQNPFADLMQQNNNVLRGTQNNISQGQQATPDYFSRAADTALFANRGAFPGIDPYKRLGEERGALDAIGEGLIDFAPYLIGGVGGVSLIGKGLSKIPQGAKFAAEFAARNPRLAAAIPNMGANVLSGAAYKMANGEPGELVQNALTGGGLGLLSSGVGYGLDKLGRLGAEAYARSAIPGFIDRATKSIKGIISPDEAAGALKANYNTAAGSNTANWNALNKTALNLDANLAANKIQFNSEPYVKSIDDYISKIQSYEPAKKEAYKEALDFAKEAKELAPKSFEGAIALRQNLNKYFKDFQAKRGVARDDVNAKTFIKDIKNTLINDTIKANSKNVNPQELSAFENAWQQANKSHQGLQEFYKSPNPIGINKPVKQTREAFQSGADADAALLNKYMPKPSQTGVEGLKQLEKLYGSKQKAQDAAKSYLLRKINEGGTNQDILTKFQSLSPAQRKYIFGKSGEEQILNTAHNAERAFGRTSSSGHLGAIGHHVVGYGLPGLVGSVGAYQAGLPWNESLLAGLATAAATKGIKAGIGKFATPSSVGKAIQFAEKGGKNQGRYINMTAQEIGTRRKDKEGNK